MRVGIFGGTFDPIHIAHLKVAEAAKDACGLDRVLVIPAANPPHKRAAAAAFEHRYRMVELACQDTAGLEPSLLESGDQRSYSIGTIEKVRESGSLLDTLYFIIGADAFAEITTWYRWQEVVASVEFIVVARPPTIYGVPKGALVHALNDLRMPGSSSEIRDALSRGIRPPDLPDPVYAYILAHDLYR